MAKEEHEERKHTRKKLFECVKTMSSDEEMEFDACANSKSLSLMDELEQTIASYTSTWKIKPKSLEEDLCPFAKELGLSTSNDLAENAKDSGTSQKQLEVVQSCTPVQPLHEKYCYEDIVFLPDQENLTTDEVDDCVRINREAKQNKQNTPYFDNFKSAPYGLNDSLSEHNKFDLNNRLASKSTELPNLDACKLKSNNCRNVGYKPPSAVMKKWEALSKLLNIPVETLRQHKPVQPQHESCLDRKEFASNEKSPPADRNILHNVVANQAYKSVQHETNSLPKADSIMSESDETKNSLPENPQNAKIVHEQIKKREHIIDLFVSTSSDSSDSDNVSFPNILQVFQKNKHILDNSVLTLLKKQMPDNGKDSMAAKPEREFYTSSIQRQKENSDHIDLLSNQSSVSSDTECDSNVLQVYQRKKQPTVNSSSKITRDNGNILKPSRLSCAISAQSQIAQESSCNLNKFSSNGASSLSKTVCGTISENDFKMQTENTLKFMNSMLHDTLSVNENAKAQEIQNRSHCSVEYTKTKNTFPDVSFDDDSSKFLKYETVENSISLKNGNSVQVYKSSTPIVDYESSLEAEEEVSPVISMIVSNSKNLAKKVSDKSLSTTQNIDLLIEQKEISRSLHSSRKYKSTSKTTQISDNKGSDAANDRSPKRKKSKSTKKIIKTPRKSSSDGMKSSVRSRVSARYTSPKLKTGPLKPKKKMENKRNSTSDKLKGTPETCLPSKHSTDVTTSLKSGYSLRKRNSSKDATENFSKSGTNSKFKKTKFAPYSPTSNDFGLPISSPENITLKPVQTENTEGNISSSKLKLITKKRRSLKDLHKELESTVNKSCTLFYTSYLFPELLLQGLHSKDSKILNNTQRKIKAKNDLSYYACRLLLKDFRTERVKYLRERKERFVTLNHRTLNPCVPSSRKPLDKASMLFDQLLSNNNSTSISPVKFPRIALDSGYGSCLVQNRNKYGSRIAWETYKENKENDFSEKSEIRKEKNVPKQFSPKKCYVKKTEAMNLQNVQFVSDDISVDHNSSDVQGINEVSKTNQRYFTPSDSLRKTKFGKASAAVKRKPKRISRYRSKKYTKSNMCASPEVGDDANFSRKSLAKEARRELFPDLEYATTKFSEALQESVNNDAQSNSHSKDSRPKQKDKKDFLKRRKGKCGFETHRSSDRKKEFGLPSIENKKIPKPTVPNEKCYIDLSNLPDGKQQHLDQFLHDLSMCYSTSSDESESTYEENSSSNDESDVVLESAGSEE